MSALPPFQLGHPRTELRRQLVEAALRGEKTATAGLLAEYEAEGEQPEPVGSRSTLLGYDDEPVAVVEITESRVVPAAEIDDRFRPRRGRGIRIRGRLADRPRAVLRPADRAGDEIVAIRFRVVERL
jgi:Uncharacterized protein conserved in bacteria